MGTPRTEMQASDHHASRRSLSRAQPIGKARFRHDLRRAQRQTALGEQLRYSGRRSQKNRGNKDTHDPMNPTSPPLPSILNANAMVKGHLQGVRAPHEVSLYDYLNITRAPLITRPLSPVMRASPASGTDRTADPHLSTSVVKTRRTSSFSLPSYPFRAVHHSTSLSHAMFKLEAGKCAPMRPPLPALTANADPRTSYISHFHLALKRKPSRDASETCLWPPANLQSAVSAT